MTERLTLSVLWMLVLKSVCPVAMVSTADLPSPPVGARMAPSYSGSIWVPLEFLSTSFQDAENIVTMHLWVYAQSFRATEEANVWKSKEPRTVPANVDLILKSGGQGCLSRMGTIFFKLHSQTWGSMVQQTEDTGYGIGHTWVPALALALFLCDIGQVA